VPDFVDRYSFILLEYEKVLSDWSPLVFWGYNTRFVAGLIGMVSLEFLPKLLLKTNKNWETRR